MLPILDGRVEQSEPTILSKVQLTDTEGALYGSWTRLKSRAFNHNHEETKLMFQMSKAGTGYIKVSER